MESNVSTVDQRPSTPMQTVEKLLLSKGMQDQLRLALPKHVTPERLARIVLTQVRLNPKLAECTRESFLGAVMECAQLGLEPGVLGQAWIIPYKHKATLVIGYRGLVALAWRSEQLASVQAHAVYAADIFVYERGLEPKLVHKPTDDAQDDDQLTHVYAVLRTTTGGTLFEIMTRHQIDRIRRRSQASSSGPWVTDYAEMAKKTVLKRLFKLAPLSVELMRGLEIDEAADAGAAQAYGGELDVTPQQLAEGRTKSLRAKLRGKEDTEKRPGGGVDAETESSDSTSHGRSSVARPDPPLTDPPIDADWPDEPTGGGTPEQDAGTASEESSEAPALSLPAPAPVVSAPAPKVAKPAPKVAEPKERLPEEWDDRDCCLGCGRHRSFVEMQRRAGRTAHGQDMTSNAMPCPYGDPE